MITLETYLLILSGTVLALLIAYNIIKRMKNIGNRIIFDSLEHSKSFAILIDKNMKVTYITSATCELLDIDRNAIMNQNVTKIFNAEDQQNIFTSIKNADISNFEIIESITIGHGAMMKHVLLKIIPTDHTLQDHNKLIIMQDRTNIVNSIRQIEKSKQELKGLSMLFESSFEESFLASIIITDDGIVKNYNKAFSALMQNQKVINNSSNINNLLGIEASSIIKNLKRDKCFEINCYVNGMNKDLVFNLHKIKKTPEATFILCQIQDITKQKQTEKTRKDLENQIRKAKKVEYLGELAGIIAHDLNNTLMPIISFSDSLANTLPDEMQKEKEKAQKILDAGLYAKEILSKISEIKYIDYCKAEKLNPEAIIADVINDTKIRDGINLLTDIDENLNIETDKQALSKTISNLLENAIEATEGFANPTIHINFKASKMPRSGSSFNKHLFIKDKVYNVLEVTNSGSFIEKEDLEQIFNPFFTTKHINKKLGTGLTFIYHFAERFNAPIFAKSSKEHGVSFQIYFPQL